MKNKKEIYDAFLSYNSKEKPMVEKIGKLLANKAKMKVWLDKWNLVPGDPWQEEMEKALEQSKCCVVFLGPNGFGPWHHEEMRIALARRVSNNSIRVVLVLLPGANRTDVGSTNDTVLNNLTYLRFENELDDPEALYRLECGIKGTQFDREKLLEIKNSQSKTADDPAQSTSLPKKTVKRKIIKNVGVCLLILLFIVLISALLHFVIVREQAINNWDNARYARERGELLKFLHLSAEAVQKRRDNKFYKILLFDTNNYCPPLSLLNIFQHKRSIRKVAADGNHILIWDDNNIFHLLDCNTLPKKKLILNYQGKIKGILYNEERKQILTWDDVNVIRLWDDSTCEQISSIDIKETILSVEADTDELRILTGKGDKIVRHWNGGEVEPIRRVFNPIGDTLGATFNADKKRIITWNSENTVRLWDALVEKKMETIPEPDKAPLIGAAFNNDETRILAWRKDGKLLIWDAETGKCIGWTLLHNEDVDGAVFSSKNQLLRVWRMGALFLWSTNTSPRLEKSFRPPNRGGGGGILEATYKGNKPRLLTWTDPKTVQLWNVETGKPIGKKMSHKEEEKEEESLRKDPQKKEKKETVRAKISPIFNKDATRILTLANDATARLWYANQDKAGQYVFLPLRHERIDQYMEKGKIVKENIFPSIVKGAIFNHDETNILTWDMDNSAQLWDTGTGGKVGARINDEKWQWNKVGKAIFNRNQTMILTWSESHDVELWNFKSKTLIFKHFASGTANGAIFNTDETEVLTWDSERFVKLWDINTGKQIKSFEHQKPVLGVVFNAKGTQILTWSDIVAQIWNARDGKIAGPLMKHEGVVRGAQFNKDETWIVTWSNDGTVRFWSTYKIRQIGPTLQHADVVNGAFLSDDETKILTWSNDNTARIWNIGIDPDFPPERIKLQVEVLTCTRFNPDTMEIEFMKPEEWRKLKEEYIEIAGDHYKKCQYRHANVWGYLYPEEAKKAMAIK